MEKPLSPNENAVSLVTKYHNQLQEWEEKLGHLTEQISNCQAQVNMQQTLKHGNSNKLKSEDG